MRTVPYNGAMRLVIGVCATVACAWVAATPASADPLKELAALDRAIGGGTWTCQGTALVRSMSATRTSRLEMNGTWMHDSVEAKLGDSPFHFEVYTAFDPVGKHFHRVMVESDGNLAEGEGHVGAGSVIDFQLDTHGPRGDGLFREHIDWSAAASTGVVAVGEVSTDQGKTWVKIYELTCKR
jgi:hypothetical protein